jgi:hypothetical protein
MPPGIAATLCVIGVKICGISRGLIALSNPSFDEAVIPVMFYTQNVE